MAPRSRAPRAVDHGVVDGVEERPLAVGQVGEVDAGGEALAQFVGCHLRGGRVDHPATNGRFPALSGQHLQLVGVDPAAFGDDALDTAVRSRS